ncbi:MAG: hypothetical protein ACFE8P_06585 [Promethearchaeota archaeon]
MKKKTPKILGFILIFLFTLNIFSVLINMDINTEIEQKKTDNDNLGDITKEEIINEKSLEEELPKTANPFESGLNFSFDTQIVEIANNSWSYENYNATGGGLGTNPPTTLMEQWSYNGANTSIEFYLTGLINSSSPSKDILRPNDFGGMSYSQYAGLGIGWDQVIINDDGPGKGNAFGYVRCNKDIPFGASTIMYAYDGYTNITYNATLYFFNAISTKNEQVSFIPTIENTISDFIEWELSFDNKYLFTYPYYNVPDDYKAIIELDDYFTLISVKGRSGAYWDPLIYDRNSTHLIIYGSYEEYKITFYSPNFISITYNEKLELQDKNELHLNITCRMDGDLTIGFTDTNGTTFSEEFVGVQKNDIINYNYIMLNYSRGGMGYLNITLINGSAIHFGVKIAEVEFYKHAFILGFTDNITAFEPNFYLGAAYLDRDYLGYIEYTEGKNLLNDPIYCINKTIIANASVTYKLVDYSGVLPYIEHPDPTLYLWLYLVGIDLRELQIRPDEYNITFEASKLGYDDSTHVLKPWLVYKRNITIDLKATDDILEVEESFSFTVNLKVNYTNDQGILLFQENYLRIPVQVNLSFINNETGEIDGPHPWGYNIVQSFSLYGEIENYTLPGIYYINVTIDSPYYQGSAAFPVEIRKKPLTISLVYDEDDLEEDEEFELQWELNDGGSKNRENMSIEVYIDGIFHTTYSLANSYGGITKLEFGDGEYDITYRLISPFYTSETTIRLEIEEEEEVEPTWLEENWLWVVIGIIAVIAMAALAIFLLISRHKMKAQRALESELIALKTKISSTEQNISLIETQISQIASIYWILVIHSEQGVTMIEIVDFKFEDVIGEDQKELIGKGTIRDSALIGGFLTAIRNFSRETSGTSLEYQPVFNSQTDYSTIVDDNEIHRRILEGTQYFMAFVSSRGTIEISDVLSSVNSIFQDVYGEAVEKFDGAISPFKPYEKEVVNYLHNEIRALQKKLSEEHLVLEKFDNHLKEVQEKIGIKPKKVK